MAISESKKKIVVDNYFKSECDINTSIKEAFTKGFELGLKKAPMPRPKTGHWINKKPRWIPSLSMTIHDAYECSNCGEPGVHWWKHCINCGARTIEPQGSEG